MQHIRDALEVTAAPQRGEQHSPQRVPKGYAIPTLKRGNDKFAVILASASRSTLGVTILSKQSLNLFRMPCVTAPRTIGV
jgi:hypothetical protein